MAKFALKLVNNWVTPLVLASIGLHGLVLALPMPDLAKPPEPEPELPEPEVIQVVSLPKLATGAEESIEPPLPEPEPEEEPPPPPEPEEIIEEELVITDPEVLDQVEPESAPEPQSQEEKESTNPTGGTPPDPNKTELDEQLEKRESYGTLNQEKMGADYREGGSQFNGALSGWMGKKVVSNPNIIRTDRLESIEAVLPPVKALSCLTDADGVEQAPSDFVSIAVEVSETDGSLVVDADSPHALNSSGHEILDKKALEIAKEADYSPYYDPSSPVPGYWFNVQIDYDPC